MNCLIILKKNHHIIIPLLLSVLISNCHYYKKLTVPIEKANKNQNSTYQLISAKLIKKINRKARKADLAVVYVQNSPIHYNASEIEISSTELKFKASESQSNWDEIEEIENEHNPGQEPNFSTLVKNEPPAVVIMLNSEVSDKITTGFNIFSIGDIKEVRIYSKQSGKLAGEITKDSFKWAGIVIGVSILIVLGIIFGGTGEL